jgi:hypothetical protein
VGAGVLAKYNAGRRQGTVWGIALGRRGTARPEATERLKAGTTPTRREVTMRNPSPRSHLYRLGILLAVCFVAFLVIKDLATPASWNYEGWYRGAVLEEGKAKPFVYGGIADIEVSERNEACRSCHKDHEKKVRKLKHRTLSCESCHGALADHAREGKKTADAPVDKSRGQCLNCHAELISRPKGFPQFTMEVKKHRTLEEKTLCLKCHGGHDPTP